MTHRALALIGTLSVGLALLSGTAAAQPPADAATPATNWTPPRTVDGQPDLQGVWANNNATPLERPKELEGRATLTDQEVEAMRRKAAELFDGKGDAAFGDEVFRTVLAKIQAPETGSFQKGAQDFDADTGDYSSVWVAARVWDNRTSLITDPPEGKMPPLTPAGLARRAAAAAAAARPPNGPGDRALSERCITYGVPQLLAGYQAYYRIVQAPDAVVVATEMIHDARVIPLDGRAHLSPAIRQWQGDSRARWEGDTLVVDTTNYKPRAFMNASDRLHLTERFTRVAEDTLNYEVTIDDPETWTKPWTLMIPLKHSAEEMFEYACHEGNVGMAGILAGARAQERAAKVRAKPKSK
jgi:hypothetical protein